MIHPMLALVLATFVMIAITKVALDLLWQAPGNEENATLIMILGSVLALYLVLGCVDWVAFIH